LMRNSYSDCFKALPSVHNYADDVFVVGFGEDADSGHGEGLHPAGGSKGAVVNCGERWY